MTDVLKSLQQNHLSYQLIPIHFRELLFLPTLPCDVFGNVENVFSPVAQKSLPVNREGLMRIVDLGLGQLFVKIDDYPDLIKSNQKTLYEITRSLSIGDPLENGKKIVYHLSLNMDYLYRNPIDDETLSLQFQCVKNLASFLISQINLIPKLYQYISRQSYHYHLVQPMLASLILLGYLKKTHHFNEKEMINLFTTSYLKDVGMGLIPSDLLERSDLNVTEKKLILKHQRFSEEILSNRIPLGINYLNIIRNHHSSSRLRDEHCGEKFLSGIETVFVEVADILTAMITGRPYRGEMSLFSSLQFVKAKMGKEYHREFYLLVRYLQKFFGFI